MRLNTFGSSVSKRVLNEHARLIFHEAHGLRISICVAVWANQIVQKGDAIGTPLHLPAAVVDDLVSLERLKWLRIGPPHNAHANAHKCFPGLCQFIAESAFGSLEFFHRSHDGVMQFGIVFWKPLAEVFVILRP